MFKHMRMSTRVLLVILSVIILVGAGLYIYLKQTGKLKSSADITTTTSTLQYQYFDISPAQYKMDEYAQYVAGPDAPMKLPADMIFAILGYKDAVNKTYFNKGAVYLGESSDSGAPGAVWKRVSAELILSNEPAATDIKMYLCASDDQSVIDAIDPRSGGENCAEFVGANDLNDLSSEFKDSYSFIPSGNTVYGQFFKAAFIMTSSDQTITPMLNLATRFEYTFGGSGTIKGRVLTSMGKPVPNEYVAATYGTSENNEFSASAYTDSDGYYSITDLEPRSDYYVYVYGDVIEENVCFNTENASKWDVLVESDKTTIADFQINQGMLLKGKASDSKTKLPISGAKIDPYAFISNEWRLVNDYLYTDANGDYKSCLSIDKGISKWQVKANTNGYKAYTSREFPPQLPGKTLNISLTAERTNLKK